MFSASKIRPTAGTSNGSPSTQRHLKNRPWAAPKVSLIK